MAPCRILQSKGYYLNREGKSIFCKLPPFIKRFVSDYGEYFSASNTYGLWVISSWVYIFKVNIYNFRGSNSVCFNIIDVNAERKTFLPYRSLRVEVFRMRTPPCFPSIFKGRQLSWIPVCFQRQRNTSKRGQFVPKGATSFVQELTPTKKGANMKMTKYLPLKVYTNAL